MKQKIKIVKEKILNLIFPPNIKCMFCTNELNENSFNNTCENCLNTLPFIQNPCPRCGSEMAPDQRGICNKCQSKNYNFVQAKSVFVYSKQPLNTVHNLKYNNKKYLANYMSQYLLEAYASWNIFPDIVTCVPMFHTKEKERGYNQSRLLAEEFSKKSNIKFCELCEKIVDTPSQTEMNTRERISNVENSFKLKSEYRKLIANKTILIIDDVITTGATTSEISKVLINGGAKECYILTFAHTSLISDNETKNTTF